MDKFLIASASGRALAQSARNAGFAVDVFDHFGDWDLHESVNASRGFASLSSQSNGGCVFTSRDYEDLFRLIETYRYRAVVIGGGLESRIELVQRLEQDLPVLGCPSIQLARLASHDCLKVLPNLVRMAGANWPVTLASEFFIPDPNDSHSSWLLKSLRGSGGGHVRHWPPRDRINLQLPMEKSSVVQQFIPGKSISALFLAQGMLRNRARVSGLSNQQLVSTCTLIGCSKQLVGEPVLGASEFAYCGSIAPIEPAPVQRKIIERLGTSIAEEFEVDGIFGLDLIENEEGIWLVDINPRIPASAELYEMLTQSIQQSPFSVFQSHVETCLGRSNFRPLAFDSSKLCLAKGVLFCKPKNGLTITKTIFDHFVRLYRESPSFKRIADIPQAGTQIAIGEPILTLFSQGQSTQDAYRELIQFAEQLTSFFA